MSAELTRLFDLPKYQLLNTPHERAFNTKINGKWESISTSEYCEKIDLVSNALIELGINEDDKVAIIVGVNCVEWHILDMAVLQIGAVDVPIYATLGPKDFSYVLKHSDAKLFFVSSKNLYDKILNALPKEQKDQVFCFDNTVTNNNWDKILDLGKDQKFKIEVEERARKRKASDLATIVYTSGTTGVPKGVMITHEALLHTSISCERLVDLKEAYLPVISYLPISHVIERLVTYYYQYMGYEIYFAESLDKLVDNLKEVKPVFLPIVPSLLEKIYDKINDKANELTGIKRGLYIWALKLAENTDLDQKRGLRHKLADKLIYSKWRDIFGGNLKVIIAGSAPIQPRLIKAFTAAGLPIYEAYGMTESPVISMNTYLPNGRKIKTVGKLAPSLEVKIAEDGEILIKGINVFKGYYKDDEKTKAQLNNDYLHTGDIGEIDEEGFIRITDRKKEMFKTSGGKYIAPAIIENIMKQSSFIEQIMVIGEGRKMPAALIQINYDYVKEWALKNNLKISDYTSDENLRASIQEDLDLLNENLGKWERVKKFEITPDEWSIEAGHLTPTFKIKRKFIKKNYKSLYDKIYN